MLLVLLIGSNNVRSVTMIRYFNASSVSYMFFGEEYDTVQHSTASKRKLYAGKSSERGGWGHEGTVKHQSPLPHQKGLPPRTYGLR